MTIKVVDKGGCRNRTVFEYAPGYVFVQDPDCREYDWLVVYDELGEAENLCCPRERTILATSEPISIKHYSRAYTRQFGHLLTNRPPEAENHPHYHLGRGYYRWLNGRTYVENRDTVLPQKSKDISVVCSAKQMRHTRHFERFRLISTLADAIPGLDWYGHGVRSFGRKCEVMDCCKYHIAVENHIAPHHWSEKLSDAFLCECLPFYAGAPDLADDFPEESFISIPIDDPEEAIRIVRSAMSNGEYERRRDAVLEAKRLILSKYNFWAQVIAVIEAEDRSRKPSETGGGMLYERKSLRWRSLSAVLEDGWYHLCQYTGLLRK